MLKTKQQQQNCWGLHQLNLITQSTVVLCWILSSGKSTNPNRKGYQEIPWGWDLSTPACFSTSPLTPTSLLKWMAVQRYDLLCFLADHIPYPWVLTKKVITIKGSVKEVKGNENSGSGSCSNCLSSEKQGRSKNTPSWQDLASSPALGNTFLPPQNQHDWHSPSLAWTMVLFSSSSEFTQATYIPDLLK